MDAKAINKFPIREYLASRGIRPAKDRSYCGLYHSPLREDHMPSMKVDYDKNLWIDYGAGEGGRIGGRPLGDAPFDQLFPFAGCLSAGR